jgi:hypothetical protein
VRCRRCLPGCDDIADIGPDRHADAPADRVTDAGTDNESDPAADATADSEPVCSAYAVAHPSMCRREVY